MKIQGRTSWLDPTCASNILDVQPKHCGQLRSRSAEASLVQGEWGRDKDSGHRVQVKLPQHLQPCSWWVWRMSYCGQSEPCCECQLGLRNSLKGNGCVQSLIFNILYCSLVSLSENCWEKKKLQRDVKGAFKRKPVCNLTNTEFPPGNHWWGNSGHVAEHLWK